MNRSVEPSRANARSASLWRRFVGHERILLLQQIEETGSISQAARAVGMSYKKAWNVIASMNQRSARPLVQRRVGGHSGGGARLTDEGRELISLYRTAEREHRRFLDQLAANIDDVQRFYEVLEC